MKLTIEGKPDEIKSMFGDSVLNKTVNPEKPDKIVNAIKESFNSNFEKMKKRLEE